MEGVEKHKVRLLPHNPDWEKEFIVVKKELISCWGANVADVQHIGSTAIKKIYAKPILDVAVRLKSIKNMDVQALTNLGYEYRGALNEKDTWHYFVLRSENQIALRHIHCYDKSEQDFDLLVGFRDYLNTHFEVAQQYQELKIRLAEENSEDRNTYTRAKEDFIMSVYDKIRFQTKQNS